MVLLSEAQQQLQQSLQALTDEEKTLLTQQQNQQRDFQWLTRNDELIREQQRVMLLQQQAQQARPTPRLSWPSSRLPRSPPPSFAPVDSQQEQTTRLAQTKQRIVEVNTRLQAKPRSAASVIRRCVPACAIAE